MQDHPPIPAQRSTPQTMRHDVEAVRAFALKCEHDAQRQSVVGDCAHRSRALEAEAIHREYGYLLDALLYGIEVGPTHAHRAAS